MKVSTSEEIESLLPDTIVIRALGPKMVCTKCGHHGADVRPDWSTQVNKFEPLPIRVLIGFDPGWRFSETERRARNCTLAGNVLAGL